MSAVCKKVLARMRSVCCVCYFYTVMSYGGVMYSHVSPANVHAGVWHGLVKECSHKNYRIMDCMLSIALVSLYCSQMWVSQDFSREIQKA